MEENNETSNNHQNENNGNDSKEHYINKKRNRENKVYEKEDKSEDEDLLLKYKNILIIPGFDGPLITYELFENIQEKLEEFPKEKLKKIYDEYKDKYENKKYMSFYHEHCDDEWFKERYHPIIKNEIKKEQSNQCKTFSKIFLDSLNNKIFENIDLSYDKNHHYNKYIYEQYSFDEIKEIEIKENTNENKDNYFAFEPDNQTLFIHQFPRNIKKMELLSILKKIKGFVSLSLSDPLKNQNFNRYCWLSFDSIENCDVAYTLLKDYKMNNSYKLCPTKSKALTDKKIRIAPLFYGEKGRDIKKDIEITEKLIDILDNKKDINHILIELKKNNHYNFDDFFHLNINLIYLRKIHGFCFYCAEMYDDERNLSTKCDYCHIYYNEDVYDEKYCNKLDEKINEFIEKISIEENDNNKHLNNEEEKIEKFLSENTIQISPEKFECNICSKKFISEHYNKKHINNMHSDKIKEVINNELKKINFIKDPNKKQYEKIKIINEMKDYVNYLNAMRKYQNPNNKKGNFHKSKHEKKKDYYEDRNSYKEGRKLISYQDL